MQSRTIPLFANEHNAGQKTTQHRSVERARLAVNREGPDPEKGQYNRDYEAEYKWDPERMQMVRIGDPAHEVRQYKAPSGAKIEVKVEHEDYGKVPVMPAKDPHDMKVIVNGVEYSQPAAQYYLNHKHGISL